MASEQQANGGDGPTTGHNVAQINETISAGFEEVYKLDCEIDRAIERHVQKTKDARKKKMRNIKADTNVNLKVLNVGYKTFKMAQDAKNDEETGAETLDMMRIMYGAMQAGEQLDWLSAIEIATPEGKAPAFVGAGDEAG